MRHRGHNVLLCWLRLNGRVQGAMRLACQVEVRGDVSVQTRAGGPPPRPSLTARAPEWKNALSNRPAAPPAPKKEGA